MYRFSVLCALACVQGHPCDVEVSTACPDRPGSELARCLQDKSEHDVPTTLSSECTDFVALNVACKEDVLKFCDEALFSDDTTLCLTQWTDQRDLAHKCVGVLEWAVPKEGDEDGRTDELGMSAKDYADKKAWQQERKAGRVAAIEKVKQDKQDEEDLAQFKLEDPEGYKQLMREREEARRSYEELKKTQRLKAAAEERRLKAERGEDDDDEDDERKKFEKRKKRSLKKKDDSKLPYVLAGLAVAFVVFTVVNLCTKDKEDMDKDQ